MDSVPVRLTTEYRGMPAGRIINASPGLAQALTSSGRAEPAPAGSTPAPCVERAIAPPGGAA